MSDWKADVRAFLKDADRRIDAFPERMPFKPMQGKLVIAWLRALVERPSMTASMEDEAAHHHDV